MKKTVLALAIISTFSAAAMAAKPTGGGGTDTTDTRLTALETSVSEAQADISALDGRVSSAESATAANATGVSSNSNRLTSVENAVAAIQPTDLSGVESRLTSLESDGSGYSARLDGVEAAAASNSARLDGVEAAVQGIEPADLSGIEARLTDVEDAQANAPSAADYAALEGRVYSLEQQIQQLLGSNSNNYTQFTYGSLCDQTANCASSNETVAMYILTVDDTVRSFAIDAALPTVGASDISGLMPAAFNIEVGDELFGSNHEFVRDDTMGQEFDAQLLSEYFMLNQDVRLSASSQYDVDNYITFEMNDKVMIRVVSDKGDRVEYLNQNAYNLEITRTSPGTGTSDASSECSSFEIDYSFIGGYSNQGNLVMVPSYDIPGGTMPVFNSVGEQYVNVCSDTPTGTYNIRMRVLDGLGGKADFDLQVDVTTAADVYGGSAVFQ